MLFLIISAIIFNIIVIFVPKLISKHELYTTGLFALVLGLVSDIYLDLKYNLYGFFDKDPELNYLIVALGLYPSVNMLFLNYFPFKKGILMKMFYTAAWTLLFVVYEVCTLRFGIMYYNKWRLIYSLFVYPATFVILALNLKFIRYLNSKA